jgi:hypothetical protein
MESLETTTSTTTTMDVEVIPPSSLTISNLNILLITNDSATCPIDLLFIDNFQIKHYITYHP